MASSNPNSCVIEVNLSYPFTLPAPLGWQQCEHWFSRMSWLGWYLLSGCANLLGLAFKFVGFFQIRCWQMWFESQRELLPGQLRSADRFVQGGGHLQVSLWKCSSACWCVSGTQCPSSLLSKLPAWSFVKSSHVEFNVTTSGVKPWYWEWVIVTKSALMADSVCLVFSCNCS